MAEPPQAVERGLARRLVAKDGPEDQDVKPVGLPRPPGRPGRSGGELLDQLRSLFTHAFSKLVNPFGPPPRYALARAHTPSAVVPSLRKSL